MKKTALTPREHRALNYRVQGNTRREIADKLQTNAERVHQLLKKARKKRNAV